MRDLSDGLPFALIAWIKREQAKTEAHRVYMLKKNAKDDEQYEFYLFAVTTRYWSLKSFEKNMVTNFAKWKNNGKLFTVKQRSAIGAMYLRHMLEK